jgi:hypothetical protein
MEDVGIFRAILSLFMSKRYILWPFGTFCSHLEYFFPVLVCCTEKNLATLLDRIHNKHTLYGQLLNFTLLM